MSLSNLPKKTIRVDDIDRKILAIIQEDSRLTYAEIGAQVGLSVSAVNDRLKKMHAHHVIKRYTAIINPRSIGIDVGAFIQVTIEKPAFFEGFVDAIQRMPEVQECHHVTGAYSCLLKVRTTTTAQLEYLLNHGIKAIPGVARTETQIVLSSVKETSVLEGPVLDATPTLAVA